MKQQTRAALCAKEIRKELKLLYPKVKFTVKSDTFANGDSVDIYFTDVRLNTSFLKLQLDDYVWNEFDSVNDFRDIKPNPECIGCLRR